MTPKGPIVALVDDDKIFQFTASKTIKAAALTDTVLQFEDGADALQYLRDNLRDSRSLPDYIFLDINMPRLDGWMFLDDYNHFKSSLAKPIFIYLVSSSIDPRDIDRARKNSDVKDYVIKPVTRDRFAELLRNVA